MIKNAVALFERLSSEKAENSWLEFKENNTDPDRIGQLISSCANGAILVGREKAYIVYGVNDKTKEKIGTKQKLSEKKVNSENFIQWISNRIEPRLLIEFEDLEYDGKLFSIIAIEPTYDRPVKFNGVEYVRIGENVRKLADFPHHERSLWLATGRHKFETALALPNCTSDEVFEKLDVATYYKLKKQEVPNNDEVIRHFISLKFITDDEEGGYNITNLGAILFANNIKNFSSVSMKSVRLIKYIGKDKTQSDSEIEGVKGYAIGFPGLMRSINTKLPTQETYKSGIRNKVSIYPESAIREIVANALIHQDFTISGAGPVIEIYSDRVEITNPGSSLIEIDRIFDERRSRNEMLASTMRDLGFCEERGGGLDKALIEIETNNLPAPDFIPSDNSIRVVLFGQRSFSQLTKNEKVRACFFHSIIRWISKDYMSNTTLRQRFGLSDDDYQSASAIIKEAIKRKKIIPAEVGQGNKFAKYVPYWAKQE